MTHHYLNSLSLSNLQVLPDFRGLKEDGKGLLVQGAAKDLRNMVQQVLQIPSSSALIFSGKEAAKLVRESYLANKHFLRAYDSAVVMSINPEGFKTFQVAHPPKPLLADRRRFYIPLEDLPPEIAVLSQGRTRRSCIELLDGTDSWLEVCWGEHRKVMFSHLDRGCL